VDCGINETRVPSKQTIFYFGSNRNKPKPDLFLFCFDVFREAKTSVYFGMSKPFRNEPKQKIGVSKQTETEINTLLCNGYGRGRGHGREHGHGHGHGHRHRCEHDMDVDMETDKDTDTIFFVSVRTEINRNSICFGSVSVFSAKLLLMDMGVDMDMECFLLFRFVSNGPWMFRFHRKH
jgi:hypothetical protein